MKALADIVNDENWCRGYSGRDAYGSKVSWESPEAVSFCMMGWLYRKYSHSALEKRMAAFEKLSQVCYSRYKTGISKANDCHVKNAAEVCTIFAEAGV